MSGKIKSKDLSYDSTLPPFLQQLRDQHTGQGDTDRHERPVARPKKAKDVNDDDGPTVVDESGDIVSKDDLERLTNANGDLNGDENLQVGSTSDPTIANRSNIMNTANTNGRKRSQAITDGTTNRKRKAAKIVGDDQVADAPMGEDTPKKRTGTKSKKKVKAIKLAFDDDGS